MEAAGARKEWRAVPDAPVLSNGAEDPAERASLAHSEGRAIYEGETGGLEDFYSITIEGGGGHSEDILQQRLQRVARRREVLQQAEIELRAQAIAHPQIIQVHHSFESAAKEHAAVAANLQEQLHERENYILELQIKLGDKDRELGALKVDHQTVWANEDLLREQTKELVSVRRERDNSEADRAQHLQKIHDIQELLRDKENQLHALEEQNRVTQDNILFKDEQLREAQAWIGRVQEMDNLQSQALQAELRERTEQFNQFWGTFQQQYVEMQQSFLHTIHRLQLEITELRKQTGTQQNASQAVLDGSTESSFAQSKGNYMAEIGDASTEGNQSATNHGIPDGSMKGNNVPAVPVPSSLLGMGGFVSSGQMAGMHSYMLHPQGISQSLASPNSGVPQFGSFQPSIQPSLHWPNQQETKSPLQTPDVPNYQPSQSDHNTLQPVASKSAEITSKQSQVVQLEHHTAHGEQQQRPTCVVVEPTHDPKAIESNVTEHLICNELQNAQDSSSNASSTRKFAHQDEKSELKGEKVTSSMQSVEQVPRKQNKASDFTGSTTQVLLDNIAQKLKSNVVNQADTLTSAGGCLGSVLPSIQNEPVLLDERYLLACIVRSVPARRGSQIRISSTLSNRLGKILDPLNWHDYEKQYGKLVDFVATHEELFVIDGDYIHLREGAQQIISATAAAAKIAAVAASSTPYSSLLPSVAVTPMAQINPQKRGPVVDSRSSNSAPSGNGSAAANFRDQQHENGHTVNGSRHERAGLPSQDKGASTKHGYESKQQGRSKGSEYISRR